MALGIELPIQRVHNSTHSEGCPAVLIARYRGYPSSVIGLIPAKG